MSRPSYVDDRVLTLEEYVDELRQDVGTVITHEDIVRQHGRYWTPWNTEVTRDNVRHLVDGLGDVNPLFRDEEHARSTRYGSLVAPPSFLYTVWYPTGTFMRSIPRGIKSFNSGGEVRCIRPLVLGDRISFRVTSPSEVVMKSHSESSGSIAIVHSTVDYFNQRGELVAIGRGYSIKAPADDFERGQKYAVFDPSANSEELLERIYREQDAEVIRGSTIRYWEDVEVGETFGPVVQGPASQFDNVALFAGSGGYSMKADRLMRTSPYGWDFPMPPHPDTGGFANHEMLMIDERIARMRHGFPRPIVMGQHRMSQMPVVLTNWIGDDGFLWHFSNQLRRVVFIGDTVWTTGEVVDKYRHGRHHVVAVATVGRNQRNEVVCRGTGAVLLPSRSGGPVTFPAPTAEEAPQDG